jgi:NAD(P)-dependent dehydrogenase (short-subunit alcohol dehydrogenase family)
MQTRIDAGGETLLVTGGATGLGFAIAQAFGAAGAVVAINDRSQQRADLAAAELTGQGVVARGYGADVRDAALVATMVEAVRADLGTPSVFVANAGLYPNSPFLEMPEEEWDRVLDTNLKGVFLTCQAVARAMIAGQVPGRIMVVSSTAADRAFWGWSHYCASKAGVSMLARAMAMELGEHGIRVNAVLPGFIGVEEGGRHLSERYRAEAQAAAAIGRPGSPEDVAAAILMLASPLAGYVSGASLVVDGGASAGPKGLRALD